MMNINKREDINKVVEKLEKYDIISFDIFDTLILRPFLDPNDMFRVIGREHNIINFYDIRKRCQQIARKKAKAMYDTREITIYDIYKEINLLTDLNVEKGVLTELEAEKNFCYANPYMKEIFDKLISKGKEIIIVSDMYIPHDMMVELLENCGYKGYSKLFVSCDYKMTKFKGDLYKYLKDNYIGNKSIIHIGDNFHSDVEMAKENKIETYYYKRNADIKSDFLESLDMSETIGSIYKGLICNHLNNGVSQRKINNIFYKYGFIYSGIFILGYVNYIHNYAKENKMDKILFLARDGFILKKVYDILYDDIPSEYCLWSRNAALRTAPEKDLNRFIWQYISRAAKKEIKVTVKETIDDLNLNFLESELSLQNINLNEEINSRTAKVLKRLIIDNKNKIKISNEKIVEATRKYYENKIENSKKVCIVDIGYRGSGAAMLKELFEEWGFDCSVKSILAISTSRKSGFDDVINLSKDVEVYAVSNYKNYDFSVKFQEFFLTNIAIVDILIASAPKPSFLYFEMDNGNIKEVFDEEDSENYSIIELLHEGILDFVKQYISKTYKYEYLKNIPSRDAMIPLMSLMNKNKYERLSEDFKNFYYTYQLTEKKNRNIESLYDVYLDEKKSMTETTNAKVKLNKKSKRKLKDKENIIRFFYTKYYEKTEIRRNVVLAQSYGGDNFSGNPYYILKELHDNQNKYKKFSFYVAVKKDNVKTTIEFLKREGLSDVKVLELHSLKYAKILSYAKYLINNVAFPNYFIKKEGQIYINTWHGTPLKGLGKSIKDAPDESANYSRNFLMVDYFIMPNKYTCEIMKNDYMIKNLFRGEYIISGYPRNSIFYNNEEREKIKKRLKLDDKKIIVYMPTWRRAVNGKHEKLIEKMDNLIREINNNLKDDELLFIKLHNLVRDGIDIEKYDKVRMFPNDFETYEFLNIADCLITDYSSVMYDFANTDKKIILYAYDEKEYMIGRSIYSSIHDMPFEIVKTEKEVVNALSDLNNKKSFEKFKDEYCYGDNEDLCRKICEYIFLKQNNNLIIEKEQNIQNDNILVYIGNLKNNYKRKIAFNFVENSKTADKIYLNFFRNKVRKNKLFINEFSNKFNFINMQGKKDITFLEEICFILFYKFKIKNDFIERKIKETYKREVKRLFPTIEFEKVIDIIGDNVEVLRLYSCIDAKNKEIYIISNNIYSLCEKKKYKDELKRLFKDFTNVYMIEVNEKNKYKVIKQSKDELFQNKKEIIGKDNIDIL